MFRIGTNDSNNVKTKQAGSLEIPSNKRRRQVNPNKTILQIIVTNFMTGFRWELVFMAINFDKIYFSY